MPEDRQNQQDGMENWIEAKANQRTDTELKHQAVHDLETTLGDTMDQLFQDSEAVRKALETASLQFAYDFPESIEETKDFPGVDMEGKRCKSDMEFAARMQQVEARAKLLGGEMPYLVECVNGTIDPNRSLASPDVFDMRETLATAGDKKRLYQRTARMLDDGKSKDDILRLANEMEADTYAHRDRMVESMEYLVGLRTEPLTAQHYRDMLSDFFKPKDNIDKLAKQGQNFMPSQPPRSVDITFANFDNTLIHRYTSGAGANGVAVDRIPLDYKNEDLAMENVTAYAKATVAPTMDAMFQRVEEKMTAQNVDVALLRANLIVVDGLTVGERMKGIYQNIQGEKPAYKQWFRDNNKDMTNEIVGMSLAAGGRVAAFVPDAQGKIPKEPVPIQREGYEPSPLKPVTMRGWHRAWNKVGLYEGRKKRFDAYQTQEAELKAMSEATERVRISTSNRVTGYLSGNTGGQNQSFHGTMDVEEVNADKGLRVGRSAHITGPRCILLAQGHSLEDIFDETKLTQEKRAAGNEYLDMAHRGAPEDWQKIGEVYAKAIQQIVPAMDLLHQNIDMKDIRNHPDRDKLNAMGNFCFDLAQETENEDIKKSIAEHGREAGAAPLTPQEIKQSYTEKTNGINIYGRIHKTIQLSNMEIEGVNKRYEPGDYQEGRLLGSFACEAMMSEYVESQRLTYPGKPLSQAMDSMCCQAIIGGITPVATQLGDVNLSERGCKNMIKDYLEGNFKREALFGGGAAPDLTDPVAVQTQLMNSVSHIRQFATSQPSYMAPKEEAKGTPTRQKIDFEKLSPKKEEPPVYRAIHSDSPKKTANKGGKSL